MLKRLKDVRPIAAAFVKYLAGPRATDSFRKRGMLLVKDEWPAVPTLARANRSRPDARADRRHRRRGASRVARHRSGRSGPTNHRARGAANGAHRRARRGTRDGDEPWRHSHRVEDGDRVGGHDSRRRDRRLQLSPSGLPARFGGHRRRRQPVHHRPRRSPRGHPSRPPSPASAGSRCHSRGAQRLRVELRDDRARPEAVRDQRADDCGPARSTGPERVIHRKHFQAGRRVRVGYRLERSAVTPSPRSSAAPRSAGARAPRLVLNSAVSAPGKPGRNTLRYRLPAKLKPGRYRIAVWTTEPDHRDQLRSSATFRVVS